MKELKIRKEDAGQRLDKFLKRYLYQSTGGFIYKMLRKKNILLNGKKASGNELLKENDLVKLFFSDETLLKLTSTQTDLERVTEPYLKAYESLAGISVIYENEHVLFASKPAGILTQKANYDDISLNEWMIGYLLTKGTITKESLAYFKPSVLNRLDRNTSGIVICSKTLTGSRLMSQCIKDRTFHKNYRLFVVGKPKREDSLTAYLKKDTHKNTVTIIPDTGKEDLPAGFECIKTNYHLLQSNNEFSYLEAELITGKTHQIRANFAAIGHPLVGDAKYGNALVNQRFLKNGITSQMLHAFSLVFTNMPKELSDLSNRTIICKEPDTFMNLKKILFTGE
ncbi:MAG: pseudouridine synthase [Lachnospiraceae bacterium]